MINVLSAGVNGFNEYEIVDFLSVMPKSHCVECTAERGRM